MMSLWLGLVWSLFLGGIVQAAPPALLDARQATCNTATNRQCWTSSFNINTDYETSVPLTGLTKSVCIRRRVSE